MDPPCEAALPVVAQRSGRGFPVALPCVQRVRKLKRCAHGASVDHVNYDPTGAQGPGVPGYLRGCAPEAYLSNESEYIHVVSLFNIL